jgi:hypothetical protein
MRIVLDTMIFDLIVAEPALLGKLRSLVQRGQLRVISTHVQEDQLNAIPDPAKREKVRLVSREIVPTSGCIVDVSRLDMAAFGTETLERLHQGGLKHSHDALIAATAQDQADVLVTEDRRLANRVKRLGFSVAVWDFQRFVESLEAG